jgi:hypothetical protein
LHSQSDQKIELQTPGGGGQLRGELPVQVQPLTETPGAFEAFLRGHPDIFDLVDYSCDDEDIDSIEEMLGRPLPEQLVELLKISDGASLRGPHTILHLASSELLASWAEQGALEELESVPIGQDEEGAVLVIDPDGEWGGPAGAVYRLTDNRPRVSRMVVIDAVRLADSLSDLLGHMADGRDAW